MLNGVIIVEKEAGYTSHDVVAKMRGICKQKKIGHTGTLDPAATGVLPVCLGSATKICDLLTEKEKEYVAELLLGVETDTQDITGKILQTHKVHLSEEEVREAILGLQGEYDQIPPMYSARKVNGKKLYELARAGKEVERKACTVRIREIEILAMHLPIVQFRVVCSKGTYIRTLCADIGERLGCGGTMQSLKRTKVGPYDSRQAVTLKIIEEYRDAGKLESLLIPVDAVFAEKPVIHVLEKWGKLLANGNHFYPNQTVEGCVYDPGEWVRVYWEEGNFAGIYTYDSNRRWYQPVKMFLEKG